MRNTKYLGYSISFEMVGATPKFECYELGISSDSIDDLKKKIREGREKITKAPKVTGYILKNDLTDIIMVSVGAEKAGRYSFTSRQFWITGRPDPRNSGKTKREVAYGHTIYRDTPENLKLLAEYTKLMRDIDRLKAQATEVLRHIKTFSNTDE